MQDFLRRAWAEVDLDALAANYRSIQRLLPPGTRVMAVLKANAYNCGDLMAARTLNCFPEDWYAVANLQEGLGLRRVSQKPILVLGYTPPELACLLAEQRITQTVVSGAHALALGEAARAGGCTLEVHLKLDTGMSRLGLTAYGEALEPALGEARQVLAHPHLRVTGTYTHLACLYELDEASAAFSQTQYDRFLAFTGTLLGEGYSLGLRHCLNSAGVVNAPHMALDMVRPGTMLFGAMPRDCMSRRVDLAPVLTVKAVVALVRNLAPGAYVGYSRGFQAVGSMTVAVLTIGYADLLRLGAGPGSVLVNGVPCPVVGGASMDQMVVDISRAGPVKAGDEAVLLGTMGEGTATVDDLAPLIDCAPNEVYCHLTGRLPLRYLQNGSPVPVGELHRIANSLSLAD